jgi:hypothetical protein
MNTISIRAFNPSHPLCIFSGWEQWYDVDYEVNGVGSNQLYQVKGFRPHPHFMDAAGWVNARYGKTDPPPPPTLASFVAQNHHRIQQEIAKRVLKQARQKPDAPLKRPKFEEDKSTLELPDL